MLLSRRMNKGNSSLVKTDSISRIDFVRAVSRVQKPSRYSGGEYGAAAKNWESANLKTCVCFPDLYEIGMGYLGSAILYELVNRREDWLAERCYAPADDMYGVLMETGIPLWSLESRRPLSSFDALLFSFTYELSYPQFLRMLDAGGVPVFARDREDGDTIVLAGGGCTANTEPAADFVDAFGIGDAEELLIPMLECIQETRGAPRCERLIALAKIPGVYVPALYEPRYENGAFEGISLAASLPGGHSISETVNRVYAENLDECPVPVNFPVPYFSASGGRIVVEIMRGCPQGCRFCQAGFTCRPTRPRSVDNIVEAAKRIAAMTGYREATLLSLSSLDHPEIAELIRRMQSELGEFGVSLLLPSLRMDAMSREIAAGMRGGRETSMTFAIEAGSQRLRDAINKGITEEDIFATLDAALAAGWHKFKLYFMCGFAGETLEDVEEIGMLVRKMVGYAGARAKHPIKFHVTQSVLVPKPVTPFQWLAMERPEETVKKQIALRKMLSAIKCVKFNWHDAGASTLEALLSRGDRRMSGVLIRAHKAGILPPTLVEGFVDIEPWFEFCRAEGIDFEKSLYEEWDKNAPLPWGHINHFVSEKFLSSEAAKFARGKATPNCNEKCVHCGLPCG